MGSVRLIRDLPGALAITLPPAGINVPLLALSPSSPRMAAMTVEAPGRYLRLGAGRSVRPLPGAVVGSAVAPLGETITRIGVLVDEKIPAAAISKVGAFKSGTVPDRMSLKSSPGRRYLSRSARI
jgi:hypothetical protein